MRLRNIKNIIRESFSLSVYISIYIYIYLFIRCLTRHLSHKMRHKTGVHENETRFLDFFFFKSSMMKYMGNIFILFKMQKNAGAF